jgi:hypothetical protein
MVVVHAVWWEITGEGEAARYAMLPVDRGRILLTEPYEQIHDLNEFVPAQLATYDVSENFNHDVLRHPAFLESSSPNSVDVLFADAKTNSFNRTTLRPIMADGRLRIPVGISKGGGRPARFAPPADFTASLNGRVDTVATEHGNSDRVAMYNVDEKVVTYIVFSEGKWSRLNSLPLHEKFTADAAITAIGRMVTTNE